MSEKLSAFLQYRRVLLTLAFCVPITLLGQVMQGPTTVRNNIAHDVSAPLSVMIQNAPKLKQSPKEAEPWKRLPFPPGLAQQQLSEDPVRQSLAPQVQSPSAGLNFDGVGAGMYGWSSDPSTPPDTNGAVGATQYVQWVNTSFIIFDKTTGAKISGPTTGNTLWQGFTGAPQCSQQNEGDPVVIYDKLANRWVFSQFVYTPTPYTQCVAVSTTSDATGSYYRYAFTYNYLDDYPKMGVWPDAYYETFNMFQGNFVGADACAYDRIKMLAGQSATQVCFQQNSSVGGLLPSDVDGTTPPPTGSPNYMMTYGTNTLNLYKFHVDFATPANSTFTGPTVIGVNAFTPACNSGTCIKQPGTTWMLDSLADRLMYRLAYRNFGTHESLVVSHSVCVSGCPNGPTGVRWYEIQNPSGTPSVAQQSTYAPDSTYRWMPSIAMDQAGNLAVGYSKSDGTSVKPSVAYAGRLATDPVSTLQSETVVANGAFVINNTWHRWGDYSAMTVDPVDDCTFWYTQEYMNDASSPMGPNNPFSWNTRIANFKFPTCGSSVTLSPSSLTFGGQLVGTTSTPQTVTLTNNGSNSVTGISISVSGDFAQSSSSCGSSLVANSSCTINVTFTPTAAGTRTGTLTVNDSAGTQTTSLTGSGTVNVSLTPASFNFGSVGVGNSSAPQAFTLSNGNGTSVTGVSVSVTGTNQGDFTQNNNCGSTLTANSSCTINVTFTPAANGSRSATLTVNDSGGTQTSSLSGTGTDVTPPVAQITAPANGSTVSSTVTVTATATDNVGITSFQLYIDGTQVASGATSPLNYSWNTGNTANGTHTIYSTSFDAAGNMGTSSTITVTVNNTSSQLLTNSGFETGTLTGWSAGGLLTPTVSTTKHHTGKYSALLGATTAPEQNGDSWLYQTVTIPSSVTAASLTFYYLPTCNDTLSNDWQEAQIQSSTGTMLAQVMKVCSTAPSWTKVYFNLISYKGQTIRIYFNSHGNGDSLLTFMYLDDVTVSVKGGPAVTLSPAAVSFGNQNLSTTSAAQTVTLTNVQSSALTGIGISFTGTNASDFGETDNCGTSIAANASCTINVTFTPGAIGSRIATLNVNDSAGTQTSSLSGTGVGNVTLTPASVDFGNQNVGTSSTPQPFTLTNITGSALTSLSMSFTGANAGDFSQTNNCGTSLASNASCTINVKFTPGAGGSRSATLSVSDSAGTQTSGVAGTGTWSLSLAPGTVSFGNQNLGTSSSPQPVTLTNNSGAALTGISVSVTGTNSGDFGQSNNCGTSLAANSSCTINVTFTPGALGSRGATLSVTDAAGTQTSSLSGTGVGGTATLTPGSNNFGNQGVGTTSSPQAFTLTNNTGSTLTSLSVSFTGANAGDFGQSNNCGTSLANSASCTINVTFTPGALGSRSAMLTVNDSAGSQTSGLSGTGTDVTAPTTQITTPANAVTVTGTVTVTATASDNVGVTSLQIYIDGAQVASGTSSPLNYSWNTANAPNGSHTIFSKASDAAGNVGTATTISVTVNNGVQQLLQNPGFETGLTGWTAGGVLTPSVTNTKHNTGSFSAVLGSPTAPQQNGDSWLLQTATIPSTSVGASLNYYYWGVCNDTLANDWQEVQVQTSTGTLLAQVQKTCVTSTGWTKVYFNLLPYKGQTIRIYLNAHGNGDSNLTYMYVDDVTVSVK
jgi:hypothetical protein